MNYFCVFDFDAGAGSSEESGSVSGCRTQPDEDGKKGTAEKSWCRGEYPANVTFRVKDVMFSELTRLAHFHQSSAPESDGSVDAAKMAELESRLAAQLTEIETLRVRGTIKISLFYMFSCSPLWALILLVQADAKILSESRAELEQQLASSTSTVAILQTEKAKLQTEVQESKKEQDDLLMLLADQDQKIFSLKQRLKDLGEAVRL